jgi:prevent-host-death family protein
VVKTLTVSQARKLFAQVLESVVRDDSPVVICRYQRPIAAIVPVSRLSAAEQTSAERRPRKARQRSR